MSQIDNLNYGFSNVSLEPRLSPKAEEDLARQTTRWMNTLHEAGNRDTGRPYFPIILPPDGCEDRPWRRLEYKPLLTETSIRLLRIFPLTKRPQTHADLHGTIICHMGQVDLKDKPRYTALSYCWGDPQSQFPLRDLYRPPEAWAAPSFEIMMVGSKQCVSVSANLYAALLSLRNLLTEKAFGTGEYPDGSACPCPHFWIDALCIDQSNNAEKSSQVAMMHRIYKQATLVNVWLGGSDPASDVFALVAKRLIVLFAVHSDRLVDFRNMRIDDESIYKNFNKEVEGHKFEFRPITVGEWLAVFAFFSRNWFSRAWVVQELALAKKAFAICGTDLLDIDEMVSIQNGLRATTWNTQLQNLALLYIDVEPHIHEESDEERMRRKNVPRLFKPKGTDWAALDTLIEIFQVAFGLGRTESYLWKPGASGYYRRTDCFEHSLMEILGIFHSAAATDARDKIFAFLGIAEEFTDGAVVSGPLTIRPNYGSSVRQVFIEAAAFCLHTRNGFEVLEMKENRAGGDRHNLPSWVPDFSSTNGLVGRVPWSAINEKTSKFDANTREGVLNIRATRIGTVRSTFRYASDVDLVSLSEFLDLFATKHNFRIPQWDEEARERWEKLRWILPAPRPEGSVDIHNRWDVLWRTLVWNNSDPIYPAEGDGMSLLACLEYKALHEIAQLTTWYMQEWELTHKRMREIIDPHNPPPTAVIASYFPQILQAQMLKDSLKDRMQTEFPVRAKKIMDQIQAFENIIGVLRAEGRPRFDYLAQIQAETNVLIAQNQHPIHDFTSFSTALTDRSRVLISGGLDWTNPRMLFRTSGGLMGNGPMATKVEDEIWLIPGLRSPAILRKAEKSMIDRLRDRDSDCDYVFIGTAYIHGIMHGEAAEDLKEDDFRMLRLV